VGSWLADQKKKYFSIQGKPSPIAHKFILVAIWCCMLAWGHSDWGLKESEYDNAYIVTTMGSLQHLDVVNVDVASAFPFLSRWVYQMMRECVEKTWTCYSSQGFRAELVAVFCYQPLVRKFVLKCQINRRFGINVFIILCSTVSALIVFTARVSGIYQCAHSAKNDDSNTYTVLFMMLWTKKKS